MNLSGIKGRFAVEWLNAATGTKSTGEAVEGGAIRTFKPSFDDDGVLYLKREGSIAVQ